MGAECPTCGRDDFASEYGMKQHHARSHGESIAGVELTCGYCGSPYREKPCRTERSRFCRVECHNRWMAENQHGTDHPMFAGVVLECEWCGDAFPRSKANVRGGQSFCSPKCKWEHQSEHYRGENHPRYSGGRANYGPGWNNTKKEAVRERDGHRCQRCGKTQAGQVSENGRRLPVHHIIPAGEFDDPQERNTMDNLITLCDSCHGRWEGIPLRPVLAD